MKYRLYQPPDKELIKIDLIEHQKLEMMFTKELSNLDNDRYTFYIDATILAIISYNNVTGLSCFFLTNKFIDNYKDYMYTFIRTIKRYIKEHNVNYLHTYVKEGYTKGERLVRVLSLKKTNQDVSHPWLGKYNKYEWVK
jgi:hypothetical protein